MASFASAWRIEVRVVKALMIRELTTRFGRENIGFLWMVAEPLLFAMLVGAMWRVMKGPEEHGVAIVTFVVSGYVPLVLFRSSVSRAVGLFKANSSLMYHRKITITDFVIARFLVEAIGHTMAFAFAMFALGIFGLFPMPYDIGYMLLGWLYYCFFTFSISIILAPLSESSELLEKLTPVTTYMMIPFSGTFNMADWVAPSAREYLLYSPPVHGMEMLRYGIFGHSVTPYYDIGYPLIVCSVCTLIGLILCRRIRKTLVVE